MVRWLPLALAALLLGGCFGTPEDFAQRVHDLRVLAVRLDPPEVEVTGEGPPAEVTLTVLAAAPGASTVSFTLRGCESPGRQGCEGRAPEDPARAALLAPLLAATTLEVPVGPGTPEVQVSEVRALPQDLLLNLLSANGLGALVGARPALDVTAESENGQETAYKRLQVSFPDAAYRAALAQVGVPFCDAAGQPEGCLPYRTRVANTNPTLTSVRVRRDRLGEDATFEPFPTGAPLLLAPGEQVTLLPEAAEGSAEAYQTLTLELETREVLVEDREELLIYSWFSTAGEFERDRTEEERTLAVHNAYQAPDDVPEGGLDVNAWIVLRDTRGGVDFRALWMRVEP